MMIGVARGAYKGNEPLQANITAVLNLNQLALGYNGFLGLTVNDAFALEADGPGYFFVGHSLHLVNGVVFGILFGVVFRGLIPLKNTNANSISKGLMYGVIMTIISAGLLVPYAYVPEQGYGLFLFDGPDGWKLPFGILVWHLIYGYFLGALWQPTEDDA
jgi:uncharacterized membrane protein YagU involved in acid resistance